MDTDYAAMRRRAREIRDQALAAAHAEYAATLTAIAELQHRLTPRCGPRLEKLTASVESVIPRNEPFGVADVLRSLEAKDPARVWKVDCVRRHISKLRQLGIIHHVKRRRSGEPAIYAWGKVEAQDERTLVEVIQDTVTQPMRTAEVVLAVLATGWKTRMIPGHFRTHVISRLRMAGFVERSGKWVRG